MKIIIQYSIEPSSCSIDKGKKEMSKTLVNLYQNKREREKEKKKKVGKVNSPCESKINLDPHHPSQPSKLSFYPCWKTESIKVDGPRLSHLLFFQLKIALLLFIFFFFLLLFYFSLLRSSQSFEKFYFFFPLLAMILCVGFVVQVKHKLD